jgi:DNA-directed RNA polymerase specialized sigma24 family protein
MASSEDQNRVTPRQGQWFTTTCWTDLMAARDANSPEALEALERLCNAYWYPLYAYIRRSGRSAEDAEDLTQAYFYQILKKNYLGAVERKKGKFRSFLLASLNHFLSNERVFRNAEKRGGGKTLLSLDEEVAEARYRLEPATDVTPEKLFELQWANTVLSEACQRLRQECETSGKAELFALLEEFLMKEAASREYLPVAEKLGMTPGAVAVAVSRLRQRLGKILREEVGRTVASMEETEAELRHLCKVLGSMHPSVLNPEAPPLSD